MLHYRDDGTRQLTVRRPARAIGAAAASAVVPVMIADAGEHATRRFLEFFAATIRNRNTRAAHMTAVSRFSAWCDHHRVGQLADIEPLHVAAYIEALGRHFEKPTVKQHLAAIRMPFDWLVTGDVLTTNPAHAVRGPRHVVKRGKTPLLTADQARALIESIDTSTLVGLRDRALIGVMTYAFARVSAVVAMRVEDYFANGKRWWVWLHEKGGKRHEIAGAPQAGAFPRRIHPRGRHRRRWQDPALPLRDRPHRHTHCHCDAPGRCRMIQRGTTRLGMEVKIGCHTFRATGITAYLEAGGTLENAQAMAAHESPRTTKLYDRTGDEITLDEVERIAI